MLLGLGERLDVDADGVNEDSDEEEIVSGIEKLDC